MNNFISLDQYRAFIKRNILAEPQMLIKNQTQPLGQIIFQCPADNFQMKDITIPATRNAVDLTTQAPLENLLSCGQLKSLIQLQKVALLNPDDMPSPSADIDRPVLTPEPVAGALHLTGSTIPNATVIVEQKGNIWAGTSNSSGVFSVNISSLAEGDFAITVTAENFAPARYGYTAKPSPLMPYPIPAINGHYKELAVTGQTVAGANIVVAFSGKSFTGQADSNGQFSVATDALPYKVIDLHFEAEGYLPKDVHYGVEAISGVAQVNTVPYLSTTLQGKASPNAQVEILIDGQSNEFADADASGDWTANVAAIKGDVTVRSLEVEGYLQAVATMTPTKLQFGEIVVDNADQFSENNTVVSGVIRNLNPATTDIAVTVTLQSGLYEGTVDLSTGVFTINGVDAKTGVNSSGSVSVTSAFYEDGGALFSILEEFTSPTLDQAIDGQTVVSGKTSPSAKVKITMAGETKTGSSDSLGVFSVGGFTNVMPGNVNIELSKNSYMTRSFNVEQKVRVYAVWDGVIDGQETVSGVTLPGGTVAIAQGDVVGDVVADATSGEFEVTLSGKLSAAGGPVTITVSHANYVTYTDTFAVSA